MPESLWFSDELKYCLAASTTRSTDREKGTVTTKGFGVCDDSELVSSNSWVNLIFSVILEHSRDSQRIWKTYHIWHCNIRIIRKTEQYCLFYIEKANKMFLLVTTTKMPIFSLALNYSYYECFIKFNNI